MERANSADRAIARGAQVIGPLVAGLLIAVIGPSNVLYLDAATFAASALLVAVGVPIATTARPARQTADEGKSSYRADLVEGLRFIRNNRLILSMVSIATVTNFLDVPLVAVILPVYAKETFGSAASLGSILGAIAAGALVGTLLFGAVGHRLPRRTTFLLSFSVGPLVIFSALVVTPPLAVLVVATIVGGLITGPINPLYETVVQEKTPPQMYGRVFGALQSLAGAGIPFGTVLAGFVVEGIGLIPTIFGMGAIYLIVTFGMFLNPALRQMEPVGPSDRSRDLSDPAGSNSQM